jgi:hypothetical protein
MVGGGIDFGEKKEGKPWMIQAPHRRDKDKIGFKRKKKQK